MGRKVQASFADLVRNLVRTSADSGGENRLRRVETPKAVLGSTDMRSTQLLAEAQRPISLRIPDGDL